MSEKLTRADVFTERTYNGAWLCSTIYGGYRIHRLYFGYSKREAVKMFIEEVTTNNE